MLTDKILTEYGLPSYENGYYSINDELTVDVEGDIRLETFSGNTWICKVYNIEELKLFIQWVNR